MASAQKVKASRSAIKDATTTWESFIKISTICGAVVGVVLLLMALTLV